MRAILVTTLVIVFALSPIPTSTANTMGPPAGLSKYGRTIWNLDALLRDTFGSRTFYLDAPGNFPHSARNFSTTFRGDCCSAYYLFTFPTARGSAFRTSGPTKPPRPNIGASGYEVPLKIRGSYIYCGSGKWLYEHGGNGPANWQISCHT